ncbi:hypothetical protein BC938DRAFT_470511 [Jimgerdemannia flammicorona]|uniref:Uncharacterized protein n=1 Tax=Jimgerdemannia flammicorona TaxID=994334 RepID=A0A433QA12_9FUNG|nr:hypothetical protein BC938DRAFT_470511 [Jimgerdemannia flammicorona]
MYFHHTTFSTAPALNPQTITKSSRYIELPDVAKQQLDELDRYMQTQIRVSEHISTQIKVTGEDLIAKVRTETEELAQKMDNLKGWLERDKNLVDHLRGVVQNEFKVAEEQAVRAIDIYKQSGRQGLFAAALRTENYFLDLVNGFEKRMQEYRQILEEIERNLVSLSHSTHQSPQAISEIMRNQHKSFLAIAGKVAQLDDAIKRQKEQYVAYRRKYYGDDRNPFDKKKQRQEDRPSTPSELNFIASTTLKPNPQPPAPAPTPAQTSLFNTAPTFGGTAPMFGGGGTFGATTSAAQPTQNLFGPGLSIPQSTRGLFGSQTASTQPQGGLFGQSGTSVAPIQTSLFGTTTTQPFQGFGSQPQQAFGATSTAQPQGGFFGQPASSAFGQPQNAFGAQTAFGGQQQTPFGGQPQTAFGGGQPQTAFGGGQPQTAFGGGQPQTAFGGGQPQTTFGGQTAFGGQQQAGQTPFGGQPTAFSGQSTAFGGQPTAQQGGLFGSGQTTGFGFN